MKYFALLLLLPLFMSPVIAQERPQHNAHIGVKYVVEPKPHSISTNIVFIVDASSSINLDVDAKAKFSKAWDTIINNFANDQLYFRVYTFSDTDEEKRTKWIDAGGPNGLKEFRKAKKWVIENTGTYSWGLKAIKIALQDKNTLVKKRNQGRLTIVLITDGGLTEAADARGPTGEPGIGGHTYKRTGSFAAINKVIEAGQKKRKKDGLEPATIVTIGIENTAADVDYGTHVKRPDAECQVWLKKIGTKYGGGYIHLFRKKSKF